MNAESLDRHKEATDKYYRRSPCPKLRSSILIVDDEPQTLKYLPRHLPGRVLTACSADEAAEILANDQYIGLVITDLRMRGHDGFWLAEHIAKNHPNVQVAAMTAYHELAGDKSSLFKSVFQKPISDFREWRREVCMLSQKAAFAAVRSAS